MIPPLVRDKLTSRNPKLSCVALLAAVILVGALSPQSAQGQATYFWRTEGTSGSWQSGTGTVWWNSGGNTIGLSSTATVVLLWDNNHFLNQTNNSANQHVHGLRFNAGSSNGFTFHGQSLRFFDFGGASPYIRNESTGTHTFNNDIRISGGSLLAITNNNTGGFTFNGAITNEGRNINVVGSRSANGADITFNGVISGTGGFFKTNSFIRVVMTAANTYSGSTTIQDGSIVLTNSGSLANSLVRLGANGTLAVGNDAEVNMISERGFNDGGTVAISAGATLTLVGNNQQCGERCRQSGSFRQQHADLVWHADLHGDHDGQQWTLDHQWHHGFEELHAQWR